MLIVVILVTPINLIPIPCNDININERPKCKFYDRYYYNNPNVVLISSDGYLS